MRCHACETGPPAFYATAPQRLSNFDRKALEGKWWKVRGYNAVRTASRQVNTFSTAPNGMRNDIEFRVPKPDNEGYWQNRLEEVIVDERGPQGRPRTPWAEKCTAWSSGSSGTCRRADSSFVLVAYKGDTQQGPYEGAFLYTRNKDDTTPIPDCVPKRTPPRRKRAWNPVSSAPSTTPAPRLASRKPAPPKTTEQGAAEWSDVFDLAGGSGRGRRPRRRTSTRTPCVCVVKYALGGTSRATASIGVMATARRVDGVCALGCPPDAVAATRRWRILAPRSALSATKRRSA